jgi:carbonic anhydrase
MSFDSPEAIIERLKAGNKRFVTDATEGKLRDQARRADLTGGQKPWAIVLSCADSRVAPELAFDTGLGELFVLRVAGNIANTDTIASIEYAVANIGSPVIVVLGHQSCGAVTAALAGGDNGYNLNHLLAQITPAVHQCDSDNVDDVVHLNARLAAKDLVERSRIISKAVADDNLTIVSAFYSLEDGSVSFHD